ncbi:hypothetical protein [Miniphocaeibacter halophilus]|uniref:Uncharacterized protein n=1 Tax=Miniphocaeibacter halophilus TaxID=2931922 RepID=A0AC61MQ70_9FIRM|nr:hypothetical protein [Miniphocaeibacter halophilus]QQK07812.1 hypothetical protein JFY71_11120 [Miniphocaeibacter halophilus]
MHLEKKRDNFLKEELKANFLYQDDIDSLYLLLSIIENDYKCNTLKPKYSCTKKILRTISNFFKEREDVEEITSASMKILNEDLSRMEFAVYLEAYRIGYDDLNAVNAFENFVLSKIPAESLKNRRKLFHNYKNKEIKDLKKHIAYNIKDYIVFEKYLKELITKYCDSVIKDNVFSLNKYLDKQLLFKFDGINTYIVEERFLTRKELELLYEKIVRSYLRSIKYLCKEALWYGINDKVLSRYN